MIMNGWGNGWTGAPMNDAAYLPFAMLSGDDLEMKALPEEVREALEAHRDELHSAADFRNMVAELMRRR